jgi:hypothetical protein
LHRRRVQLWRVDIPAAKTAAAKEATAKTRVSNQARAVRIPIFTIYT